jgi:ribonuclease HI
MENEGWLTTTNGPILKLTVARLQERTRPTSFQWVKGHSGNPGNEGADELAGIGSRKEVEDEINTTIPRCLVITGAKLQALTQSSAYKIIRKIKAENARYIEKLRRPKTSRNIALAIQAASEHLDTEVNPKQIWRSIRSKDLPRQIRFFLWMLTHDGYKVGSYWRNIDLLRERGQCEMCGVEESMEHILTKCNVPGQVLIWELASALWQKRTGSELIRPTVSQIIACMLISTDNDGKKLKKGQKRLKSILISESAYLIWKLRNSRTIKGKDPPSRREIHAKWTHTLNCRLQMDCLLTDKRKFGTKSLNKKLVSQTWKGTLTREDELPNDWIREPGDLVGIAV